MDRLIDGMIIICMHIMVPNPNSNLDMEEGDLDIWNMEEGDYLWK